MAATLAAITLVTVALAGAAAADEPVVRLRLDGGYANSGSAGGAFDLRVAPGAAAPTTVPGILGEALHFDGPAGLQLPLDLHLDTPRHLTITAWVRLDPAMPPGEKQIVTFGGRGPKVSLISRELQVQFGRGSVHIHQPAPTGEWVFIGAVLDLGATRGPAAGSATLYFGQQSVDFTGIDTSNTKDATRYRDPQANTTDKRTYVFVGATTLANFAWPPTGVAIDDVRIYPTALTRAEIDKQRTTITRQLDAASELATADEPLWHKIATARGPEPAPIGARVTGVTVPYVAQIDRLADLRGDALRRGLASQMRAAGDSPLANARLYALRVTDGKAGPFLVSDSFTPDAVAGGHMEPGDQLAPGDQFIPKTQVRMSLSQAFASPNIVRLFHPDDHIQQVQVGSPKIYVDMQRRAKSIAQAAELSVLKAGARDGLFFVVLGEGQTTAQGLALPLAN